MVRVGSPYQASVLPDFSELVVVDSSDTSSDTSSSDTSRVASFLRRCAALGLPPAFSGSQGAREELCIEALRRCAFDEANAILDLSAPCANRYDIEPERHTDRPTRRKRGALRAGDCVLLRPPPGMEPYVALLERVHADRSVTCRWFYRHADLHPTCAATTAPSHLELFLSPLRNRNGADKVLGRCTVAATPTGKKLFCRSLYLPHTHTIVATSRVRALQEVRARVVVP
jgi:hypothetical protein